MLLYVIYYVLLLCLFQIIYIRLNIMDKIQNTIYLKYPVTVNKHVQFLETNFESLILSNFIVIRYDVPNVKCVQFVSRHNYGVATRCRFENCRANEYTLTCIRMRTVSLVFRRVHSHLSLVPCLPVSTGITREIAGIFNSTVHAHVRQANALDKQELINHREFAAGWCLPEFPSAKC